MYKYFISYSCKTVTGSMGSGNCMFITDYKIDDMVKVRKLEEDIVDDLTDDIIKIIILNYMLVEDNRDGKLRKR